MRSRSAIPADFEAILALNEESVHFLSPLDRERLVALHAESALHRVLLRDDAIVAFILAFREGAAYDSVNYRWFAQRYPSFLYIDRVVVSQSLQAGGAGTLLYRDAFNFAAAAAVPILACEFDVAPPNPVSEKFHAKFGFREVGRQTAGQGKKMVSLQLANTAAFASPIKGADEQ